MPLVGFGLWKVPNETCADTVYRAIQYGYRLFDCACDYGNEKEAGDGVRRAIADGLVKREDLWITTKIWNTFHAPAHVHEAARMQLQHWGLEYFDLLLVHFPIALQYVDPKHRYPPAWWDDNKQLLPMEKTPMQATWKAYEELVDQGLVKNIGISNCSGSIINDMMTYARYEPQVLQVEMHPYLNQEALVQMAKSLGMAMTGYSSFGPQGYIELQMDKGVGSLFKNDVIVGIAKKHGKTPAQVLLRWSTQRGIAVLPKATDSALLKENFASTSFNLDEVDLKKIGSLNRNIRFNDPADFSPKMSIFA
ncbi:Aldo/keto reductase [Fistulina hepatica ATCC 64428]|uniref:Aldo/keto reductase n=1 Tax=Fistulina hepatica ATCC 64428 TaxID=1128425 RepID=A0A0D7AI91_9AGAR|nr:Aldo/keto reductase [Fistulina hepatica ATCC 64428]